MLDLLPLLAVQFCAAKIPKALDFCVSKVAGVRISGISGSDGTGTRGLAFTLAVTSAINVVRTSSVRRMGVRSARTESKILLVIPIIRSQTPLTWEA